MKVETCSIEHMYSFWNFIDWNKFLIESIKACCLWISNIIIKLWLRDLLLYEQLRIPSVSVILWQLCNVRCWTSGYRSSNRQNFELTAKRSGEIQIWYSFLVKRNFHKCPSVRLYVRQSVRPSVRQFILHLSFILHSFRDFSAFQLVLFYHNHNDNDNERY